MLHHQAPHLSRSQHVNMAARGRDEQTAVRNRNFVAQAGGVRMIGQRDIRQHRRCPDYSVAPPHTVRERNENLRTSRKSRRRYGRVGKSHNMTLIRANVEYPSRHCRRTQGIAQTAAMWHIGNPAYALRWRRYANVERVKSTITCAYSRACYERFAPG